MANDQRAKSVMYVSQGNLVNSDEKELTKIFWGLANSDQQFLWVLDLDRLVDQSGLDYCQKILRKLLEKEV